ncbi:MAG: class I SAM-dependent methyltransferase [Actinomycetota bacterium]|nr:class I SAM-dependent methyltransferase [Actinomycetota bacterium]
MIVPDDYRQESRTRWARSAAGWQARREEMRTATMPVSVWMVEALDPQPGHELLELAAGIGDVGFLAAEMIAPGGTLICSDFVPEMLTAAQARARELGIENVRFRQIDASQSIDQPAASLDGVLCRWGYMLMEDSENALRETRRILRPGARVALAAWAGPEENRWASTPMRELVLRGIVERPDPEAPGQFAWAREGMIAERLQDAGFGEHRVEALGFVMAYASFEAYIDTLRDLALALRETLDGLDPATREDVLAAVRLQAEEHTLPDGSLAIPARTWVAAATA